LVAYLVPRAADLIEHEKLQRHLRARLPAYMVPAIFEVLPRLPTLPSGKVDRKALLELQLPAMLSERDLVGPRNEIETLLFRLWEDVLGRPARNVHDNFFEMGGHSLLATRLVSRIRAALDMELPIRSLFERPTIAGLAERIEGQLIDELTDESSRRAGAAESRQPASGTRDSNVAR